MSDSQSYEALIKQYQDQLAQMAQRPAAMPTGSPDDGSRRSWTGLLGGVLGGGQGPGYQLRGGEADTSGNRALLNFGIQTLLASGPAPVRPDLLSAVASGLQGAQSSTDLDQRRGQAQAQAQYGAAKEQQEMQLARLKEALPLLKLQQEAKALAALKGGATSTAAGPAGGGFTGDKEKDRALIVQRESGGDPTATNYVVKADPSAYERGATASGKYQFVNSTWAEGMKLAGLDPAQYPTARSAPEAVQDKVFDVIYAKHGTKPWEKGTRDWVKGTDGKYQLATVAPSAPTAPGAPPAAPPAAPGAAPAPPGVQVGGPAPPPPGGTPGAPAGPGGMAAALPQPGTPATVLRETQQRMPDGSVRTVVTPTPAVPPTAGAPPPAQVSANVGAILGGMDRASTATPASAMPMVGGPGAGPSAQPQPPAEAGWGAGNRATGYGGGAPPGMAPTQAPIVAPNQAPIVAPGAAPVAPAMATPPPFAMRPLTPTEAAATSYALDPAVAAQFKKEKDAALTVQAWQAADAKEQAAIIAQREKADTARLAIEASARKEHHDIWQKQQDVLAARETEQAKQAATQAAAAEAARQKFESDLELKREEGRQTRESGLQTAHLQRNNKMLEQLDAEAKGAASAKVELDGLKALSDNVDNPSVWATIPWGNTTALNRLTQAGLIDRGVAGANQALQSGISNVVKTLRSGMAMGSLSDRDLSYIESLAPNMFEDKDTRTAVISYLQRAQQQKIKYNVEVNKLMTRPGMNMADALDQAQAKLSDIVPPVSQELWEHWDDGNPVWTQRIIQWAKDNDIKPGTLFRVPSGKLYLARQEGRGPL